MRKSSLLAVLSVVAFAAVGCAVPAGEDEGAVATAADALTSVENSGILRLVNDKGTTLTVLDVDCALYADSARNIIRYRDGKDKVFPSADDNLYDTIAELDAVPEVGPATLTALRNCAIRRGFLYRLTSADVASVTDSAATLGGISDHASSVCTTAAGSATACIAPCTANVTSAGRSWLEGRVTASVGTVYPARSEAIQSFADAARAETADQTQCWSQPDCQAVNAVIACQGG